MFQILLYRRAPHNELTAVIETRQGEILYHFDDVRNRPGSGQVKPAGYIDGITSILPIKQVKTVWVDHDDFVDHHLEVWRYGFGAHLTVLVANDQKDAGALKHQVAYIGDTYEQANALMVYITATNMLAIAPDENTDPLFETFWHAVRHNHEWWEEFQNHWFRDTKPE